MNRAIFGLMAGFTVVCLSTACGTFGMREPQRSAEEARKPRATDSMRSILSQTAAVVEGTVTEVRFEYDEKRGPRTITALSDLRIHLGAVGSESPSQVLLDSFGGKLPNGKMLREAHVPTFGRGQTVLVFLRNTEWFFSPVVGRMAFRVETVAGKRLLITGAGAVVTGVDRTGPRMGALLLPLNPDGTWLKSVSPEVTSKTVASALGPEELVAAVREFSNETRVAVGGSLSPVPVSNRPRWNVFPVTRADPAARPDNRRGCVAMSPPDGDSDDREERIGLSQACVTDPYSAGARGRPRARAARDEALILKTIDGRQWRGGAARIEVYSPLPGQPAVAKISWAVSDDHGQRLGVYAELSPSALLDGSSRVKLDGKGPTRPGLGVLSYGTLRKPVIVEAGNLAMMMRGAKFSGSLETDAAAVRSATFEGTYAVECFVKAEALRLPANGSLSGGEVLASDEEFETDFCRPFKRL